MYLYVLYINIKYHQNEMLLSIMKTLHGVFRLNVAPNKSQEKETFINLEKKRHITFQWECASSMNKV